MIVTPETILETTDVRILRYLYGKLYFLCRDGAVCVDAPDDHTLISAVPCDLDGDGKTKVMASVTYLGNRIVHFDPETVELTVVYDKDPDQTKFAYSRQPPYMMLDGTSLDAVAVMLADARSSAALQAGDYTTIGQIGSITAEDGELKLFFAMDGADAIRFLLENDPRLQHEASYDFFDITPSALSDKTAIRMIERVDRAVYFVVDERYAEYRFSGAFSLLNAVRCDLNEDGYDEILASVTMNHVERILHYDSKENVVSTVCSADEEKSLSPSGMFLILGEASVARANVYPIYAAYMEDEYQVMSDDYEIEYLIGCVDYYEGKPRFRLETEQKSFGGILDKSSLDYEFFEITPPTMKETGITLVYQSYWYHKSVRLHFIDGKEAPFATDITPYPTLLSAVPCGSGRNVVGVLLSLSGKDGTTILYFNRRTQNTSVLFEGLEGRVIIREQNGVYLLCSVDENASLYELREDLVAPTEQVGRISLLGDEPIASLT